MQIAKPGYAIGPDTKDTTGREPIKEIGTRPWHSQYEIKDTTIIAETPELRALHITLAEADVIPWHHHNHVTENFTCARGVLVAETRAPRGKHRLAPGERLTLPPKTAHRVRNRGKRDCCFVLVQGVGADREGLREVMALIQLVRREGMETRRMIGPVALSAVLDKRCRGGSIARAFGAR